MNLRFFIAYSIVLMIIATGIFLWTKRFGEASAMLSLLFAFLAWVTTIED